MYVVTDVNSYICNKLRVYLCCKHEHSQVSALKFATMFKTNQRLPCANVYAYKVIVPPK